MTRGRRERERELDEEIAGHLAMAEKDRVARGESPEAAARNARREFGNEALVKEAARAQWGWGSLDRFRQDVRYGLRLLRRSPGFAAVAIVTLALGIGASTAILSVVDGILVRPLAYRDPGRLVVILHNEGGPVAPANFLDWKAQSHSFENMGAAEYWTPNLTGGDTPEKMWAIRMTADVLPVLGVRPALGRWFSESETRGGADHVVVLGHAVWKNRFGADPGILGQPILLDGQPYTVVGVMPPSFRFAPFWATQAQLWAPLDLSGRANNRSGASLRIFARLKDGVSVEAARRDIAAVTSRLEREFPGTNRNMMVIPLLEKVVGDVRPALLVLLAAVGLVLLIACANVANMLLARSSVRQREVALRAALGASRGRTIRQLLTESLVLALAGGAAGAALGAWALRLLVAFAPPGIPRIESVHLDLRILLATFAVSLLSGAAFGLAPALQSSGAPLQGALKEGGSAGAGREGGRLRRVFAAAEVAIAIVLLIGGGLMVRTFLALKAIDPGWNPDGVVTLEVSVAGTRYAAPEKRPALYREVFDRLSAVPGVSAAGAINHIPVAGDVWGFPYAVEGRPKPLPGESPVAVYRAVLPGYFSTMRLSILRGRDVAWSDDAGAPGVVLVNEHLAAKQWPGEDPLGRRIVLDESSEHWLTVVGVVKNAVRSEWNAEPDDEVYLAALQTPELMRGPHSMSAYLTFVVRTAREQGVRTAREQGVRTAGDPAALAPSLRAAIRSIDRTLPVSEIHTMREIVTGVNGRARFQTLLLSAFAGAAALLAAIGIYGVMSYAVSRRTREIGVRMALGADPGSVLRLVVGQGMAVALAGAGVGLLAALLLTRMMAGILYGVRATDPVTYACVAVVLLAIALAASWVPARRAARIDPMRALRTD